VNQKHIKDDLCVCCRIDSICAASCERRAAAAMAGLGEEEPHGGEEGGRGDMEGEMRPRVKRAPRELYQVPRDTSGLLHL